MAIPQPIKTMRVILFEDQKAADLYPASLARPTAMIPCGGYRLEELVQFLDLPVIHAPRHYLRGIGPAVDLQRLAHEGDDYHLFINGRIVPNQVTLEHLKKWVAMPEPGIVAEHDALLAALVPSDLLAKDDLEAENLAEMVSQKKIPRREISLHSFDFPHQIIQQHLECLTTNLAHRTQYNEYDQPVNGLFLAPGASMDPTATYDLSDGMIVIERDARVGPHAHLQGPMLLGSKSVVQSHASIGPHVVAENNCKLGGEISCSIIAAYSNKSHFGFLGHSYLGSWVNLGAGTTNSNLKNTYGEIHVDKGDRRIATGMQFLGCLIGDHTKTAIGTHIFTGKTIGMCSMLYGTVAENVPSFVNYAKQFGKLTAVSPAAAATIQARTFARRGIIQTPDDLNLLNDLYNRTQSDREHFSSKLPVEPLVL